MIGWDLGELLMLEAQQVNYGAGEISIRTERGTDRPGPLCSFGNSIGRFDRINIVSPMADWGAISKRCIGAACTLATSIIHLWTGAM